ncbi:MAG: CDP-diacylglycerol--serine O-phosphatidyltransferase, partial [Prevotellaceae bacterium]|nr:CDP-diacylglycerol--serine O-phosphatidyltransferase [Prevotellaceae bacterium]
MMNKIKDTGKNFPNTITCLNLFTGCIAVWLAFQGNYAGAMLAILLSGVFDFFDGLAARALNAYSPLGKELDSLADVISFGLAPGAIVFSLLSESSVNEYARFAAFLIPVFSALRLAKFNIDERQTSSFIGLPVPANAIFWAGMAYSYSGFLMENPLILLGLTVLFCFLMVSELPMFSLKFSGLSWNSSSVQYVFLTGCALILLVLQLNAPAAVIAWYIVLSIGLFVVKKAPSNSSKGKEKG